ncbi:cytochrome bd-type quinol oxidase subunit 1 [Rhodoligotrophos appendicifer]|uniref:DUF2842 domain-containing protein n=1 Tax=Rhodoligotrophos appendicifer TaxID=987056 RepID=UPI001478835E|nr:DUF2842 domain-containing protein [Rhodoligotrophos appendicifer]
MFSLPRRIRKLIGTVVLVVFIIVYCLAAMVYGATHMPGASVWAQTLFYLIGGLLWVIPAMAIVSWMQKPDAS